MSSPLVPVVVPPEPPQALTLVCANCGAALSGDYCAVCGQRHEPHLHTVAHFAAEAFESISHADSRLWKTLWYLVSRPGFLTREFFDGKRVRYLPPFRLYLVISVVFFLTVGSPEGPMIVVDNDTQAADLGEAKAAVEGLGKGAAPASEALKKAEEVARSKAAEDADESQPKAEKGLARRNAMTEFCDEFKAPDPGANKNYERMRAACAKVSDDSGAELGRAIVHNIPKAMFVFLPLLALAMKPLYFRPKRYYVEHLLFLIHNHAFVFLALTVMALLNLIPVVGDHLGLLEFAVWLYIVWYLYRGMRNVYQQGRALTITKYVAVGFFYFCAALTVLLLTALFSVLTFS
jgi:hypothetical protein